MNDSPAERPPARQENRVLPSRFYGLARFAVSAAVVALSVWLVGDVLMVVFAAVLLAVILHGLSDLLHRFTRLPYWLCLLVVVLVVVAAAAGLVLLAGPGLVEQATQLRKALGEQVRTIHDRLSATQWGRALLGQLPTSLGGSKEGGGGGGVPSGVAGSVAGFLGSAFGLLGTVVVVVISGLYLAASPATYANGLLRLVPQHRRVQARELLLVAGRALWMWSAGQAVDMLAVGILSGLGLWLIGVPLALVLGVIAALCNFVPYIGAIAGSLPAIALAFSAGATQGLETIGLYVVIQGFEGNVMAPLIQKRAVDLPPGLTILSQTAFGSILGVAGLIFATPMTAALLAACGKATEPLDDDQRV